MCEIFAMSSRFVENVSTSLDEFSRHGGSTKHHKDGWGIAFYEDGDVNLIREIQPASGSAYLEFIRNREFNSKTFICHIRKATQGKVTLRNTHPFVRELSGKMHVFAHNGRLGAFDQQQKLSGRFQPVGESDSEFAFCYLLDALAPLWQEKSIPELADRMDVISEFAAKLRNYGPANFIYADGDAMFVHGHERMQEDGSIAPPGLFKLCRYCQFEKSPFLSQVLPKDAGSKVQQVTLVASIPLTEENWTVMESGELLALRDGRVIMEENISGKRTPCPETTALLAAPA
ncbi:MAG: class II glutamine amidotransferase [SAR324 cluster bacterium]|nr:class II glutamine amidotransferase [SAR324 cluster bacterium]MBL7035656.1 class II glutamine amidotransferase [SAR324 cluster bacterium]